ncbi:MAG: hypothetical protein M3Y27_02825, partial [Acidobacteriota bacterium]|nr:hypothetical protein [Acidobacteriota bacterium]
GRAGARGVASTFNTRSERAEIRKIERELNVRLVQREVPTNLVRETKQTTKVIVMPADSPKRTSRFTPRRRTFGGR